MDAKVCMLGSTAIASETLKNLVLPGIGHLTVVDSALVEASDLGQNFFLEAKHNDFFLKRDLFVLICFDYMFSLKDV